jgi:hypothetical protein
VADLIDSVVQPRFLQEAGTFGLRRLATVNGHEPVIFTAETKAEEKVLDDVDALKHDYFVAFLHVAHKPGKYVQPQPGGAARTVAPDVQPHLTLIPTAKDVHRAEQERLTKEQWSGLQKAAIDQLPKLRDGKPAAGTFEKWGVTMRPVLAQKSCLDCHEGAKAGDTLGVMVYAVEKNATTDSPRPTADANRQAPVAPRDGAVKAAGPRQPGGLLRDRLGEYLTIEGVLAAGGKIETGTLLVDTVDGKKLAKPVPLVIRNLKHLPTRARGEAKQRFVLKGYESGEMIGVAPAVWAAAKEQGWKDVNPSPAPWQWRPYFVALVAVEPEGLELARPWALTE